MGAYTKRARRERGAVAVEFGLISIVMLTLIVYIIQFAIWFWAYQVGSHAAREGARAGAVNPCDAANIEATIRDRLSGAADGTASVPPPEIADGDPANPVLGAQVGDTITVRVTFDTHEVTNGFLPFPLPVIDKSATARIENVPAGGGC